MGYTRSQTMHHNELVLTYRKWTLYILMGGKTDWTVMIIPSGSEDECTPGLGQASNVICAFRSY